MFTLMGHGIGTDIIIAKAWINIYFSGLEIRYSEILESEITSEIDRLRRAIKMLDKDFEDISASFKNSKTGDFNNLIDSQRLILNDPLLVVETEKRIAESLINAECALVRQLDFIVEQFSKISNLYFQERKVDVEQIVGQLVKKLSLLDQIEKPRKLGSELAGKNETGWICVSDEISINEVSKFIQEGVRGFAIESGSPTSHLATLFKSLEIPAILGLQEHNKLVEHGERVILDSESGVLLVGVDSYILTEYEERIKKGVQKKQKLKVFVGLPCQTKNKVDMSLMANIENPAEAIKAIELGVSGIGLFRTEFLFLEKNKMLSEDEQFEAYKRVIEALNPLPVVIRTLDLGADKLPASFSSKFTKDSNPALGQRGIRLSLENPDFFKIQINAILRASKFGNVKIMLPLITEKEEIIKAKQLIYQSLGNVSDKFCCDLNTPSIGAMIEVPSAAIAIESLIPHIDFASLGTNDLIQYTLAIDRTNNKVSHLYNPGHPAVQFLIENVIKSCIREECPVSICGELANDIRQTRKFFMMGLREVSVNISDILNMKEAISKIEV
ncbi:MAG: phosphoenolpyruvate--protein phosphotransferase [Burkholderiaceae bacterium]|nr:MAG: phosphoenolpyruvate--protein phosphotransferase [Burkholderiaceae bacterium]